ncbi:RNA polymerase sigma-I factor [Fictibacillus sp. Mic-4]|uniref:RNA polymerase sigma-I factor n=1 Tax=Fictibacillus TaxID=1329200 RepID=UPI00040C5DBE|nr:RNA polymerase sigma-I factor [Fictibacillus gelatini]
MSTMELRAFVPSINKTIMTIEDKVLKIQRGNDILRNELIEAYQPFIKKVTSKVCSQYIDRTMDEFSVGLFAFNEAIDQYQEGQGSRFLSFADMVIRRRVIDYIRKEVRQNRLIYLQPEEEDEEGRLEESYAEQKAALDYYEEQVQSENRVYEIEEYQKLLKEFGLNFKVLSKHCPKHVDARENAKEISRLIVENKELADFLMEKKQLPIKDLLSMVSCSRKTIERNRKYIIAVSLIYLGDFKALKSYIQS